MPDAARVEPARAQVSLDEVAEEIVADAPADGGVDAEPVERDRGVRGAAARLEEEVLRGDQLARTGQPLQRRDEDVGDEDATQSAGARLTRPRRQSSGRSAGR